MHDLADSPTAGPIRRVKLLVVQASDGGGQFFGQRFEIFQPLSTQRRSDFSGRFKATDRVAKVGTRPDSYSWKLLLKVRVAHPPSYALDRAALAKRVVRRARSANASRATALCSSSVVKALKPNTTPGRIKAVVP